MTEGNRPQAKRGRPSGLLINPVAVDHLLGDRTRIELADTARVSAAKLSQLMTGAGATIAVAHRLADALECPIGVIFPEMVGFQATVRVFERRGVDA
jgi:hypothetical protein